MRERDREVGGNLRTRWMELKDYEHVKVQTKGTEWNKWKGNG